MDYFFSFFIPQSDLVGPWVTLRNKKKKKRISLCFLDVDFVVVGLDGACLVGEFGVLWGGSVDDFFFVSELFGSGDEGASDLIKEFVSFFGEIVVELSSHGDELASHFSCDNSAGVWRGGFFVGEADGHALFIVLFEFVHVGSVFDVVVAEGAHEGGGGGHVDEFHKVLRFEEDGVGSVDDEDDFAHEFGEWDGAEVFSVCFEGVIFSEKEGGVRAEECGGVLDHL